MSEAIEFGMQIIKYGDVFGSLEDAILCEKAGFDHISFPDHLFHPLDERWISEPAWDAFVLLSALATQTKGVKLATGVSDPLRRHPATIAHIIATLDILSKGRARLGMGTGERFTFNPLLDIKFEKPATLLREALIVIKGLWKATRDKPLNFDGKFLKVKNGYLGLYPIQKYPPILVGGYGPKVRKIVAELADYWLPWLESVETYEKSFKEIKQWAKEFEREGKVKGAVMTFSYIGKDEDEVLKALARRVKVSLALRKRLLEDLGYKDYAKQIIDLWQNPFDNGTITKIYQVADSLPDEVVEKVAICGTKDDVVEKIERFRKVGVKLFVIIPPLNKIRETVEEYKWVIKYFKEQER